MDDVGYTIQCSPVLSPSHFSDIKTKAQTVRYRGLGWIKTVLIYSKIFLVESRKFRFGSDIISAEAERTILSKNF
jgi:hypothetical protein